MKEALIELEKQGLITLRSNVDDSLMIANYTPKVQYDRLWDDITMQCRGLILDHAGNIIARPFKKFFNIEEHDKLPDEQFEVFEKMDGSLGIGFWYKGEFNIATRGSFISDQAIKANELIKNYNYKELDKENTYLFEIIYPQNRIVIDYGDVEKLCLLAVIDTVSGNEMTYSYVKDLARHGFEIVYRHNGINDLDKLREKEQDNREGFVIRFAGGMRVKAKYAEYVRLHRIITQVSNKSIWEYLKVGKSFDEVLKKVPDEFYQWVKDTKDSLQKQYLDIDLEYTGIFEDIKHSVDRKSFALEAIKHKHPGILFNMLDCKTYGQHIWKIIKPKFEKPFKTEI